MKKRNTKSLKLRKKLISNLHTNNSYKLRGGRNTGQNCPDTGLCGISDKASCYSPCGGHNATTGCNG